MISKKLFKEMMSAIEKQRLKDLKFCKNMESYLDGNFVPTMSDISVDALIRLLVNIMEGTDNVDESWISWWLYDVNCEGDANIDGKEYIIKNTGDLYDLIKIWNKHKLKINKNE